MNSVKEKMLMLFPTSVWNTIWSSPRSIHVLKSNFLCWTIVSVRTSPTRSFNFTRYCWYCFRRRSFVGISFQVILITRRTGLLPIFKIQCADSTSTLPLRSWKFGTRSSLWRRPLWITMILNAHSLRDGMRCCQSISNKCRHGSQRITSLRLTMVFAQCATCVSPRTTKRIPFHWCIRIMWSLSAEVLWRTYSRSM